jgi:hypothetical protein
MKLKSFKFESNKGSYSAFLATFSLPWCLPPLSAISDKIPGKWF